MRIAACIIKLNLPGVSSLKEKRQILKSILPRLRREFNIASAETDYHDIWQTAEITLVTVGSDSAIVHGRLQKTVTWLEENRPDLPIDSYTIEFL